MKCSYRGSEYTPTHPTLKIKSTEVIGQYRGKACQRRHVSMEMRRPVHSLTYRGVAYTTGVSTAAASPSAVRPGPTVQPIVDPSIAPTAAPVYSSRAHTLSELDKVHNAFLHKNLKERLAVAKAQGNQDLVKLLEVEARELSLPV